MKNSAVIVAVAVAALSASLAAQDKKPVPNDSVRVFIPGCTKGYVFTAGPKTIDEPGNAEITEGMHIRMNGPKKMMTEIKAHEGSMIELTGIMKKGQYKDGVNLGGGIRMSPGAMPSAGGMPANGAGSQQEIDVEGWRPIAGSCRT
jgi:hypothetical protein